MRIKTQKNKENKSTNPYSSESLLIKNENYAKNYLFNLQQEKEFINQSPRNSNVFNGWTAQSNYYEAKYKQLCSASQSRNISRTEPNEKYETLNSNLIPKLKQLLQKLQSPERKKDSQNKEKSAFNLVHIKFLEDLKQKRRQSLKVSEIIKNSQNKNMSLNPVKDNKFNKPFNDCSSRLNSKIFSQTGELRQCKKKEPNFISKESQDRRNNVYKPSFQMDTLLVPQSIGKQSRSKNRVYKNHNKIFLDNLLIKN